MNIPEGWKLVPMEPTPAMVAAYSVAAQELTKRHLLSGSYPATWQPIEAGYTAMLTAAPTPPAQQDDEAMELLRNAAVSLSLEGRVNESDRIFQFLAKRGAA